MSIDKFPIKTFDKIRYADTDRQGHVNNALFNSFLETGRVEILYSEEMPILTPGHSFVIAKLSLEFLGENRWPGRVDIGTSISKVGNSSLQIYQELYQETQMVAKAETVIVHIDNEKKKGVPLDDNVKDYLSSLALSVFK